MSTKSLVLRLLCVLGAVVNVRAVEHIITVGKAAHKFDPETVYAAIGDIITYEFYPLNHSVVRSAWGYACIPYEMVIPQTDGFFSGFYPVKTIPKNPPRWSVTVNDTNPIFFYCSAPDSCNHWGMVGVVNPREDQPLATFRDAAKNASYVLQPGQGWPSEAEGITTAPNAPTFTSATGAAVTVTATPTPDPTSSHNSSESTRLSAGGIAGVAIGAAAVVALIGSLFFFLGRRKDQQLPPIATAYEKPGPVSFIAPMSPQLPPPPSEFVDHAASYRGYTPDPRAFPPQSLVDDKWRDSTVTNSGPPVEMMGSPSGDYYESHGGHSRAESVGTDPRWEGMSPVSVMGSTFGRDPREGAV